MERKARAAVVGATGLAGQQFLAALADHPTIEVSKLAASSRSAGKTYADAIRTAAGQSQWFADRALAPEHAGLVVFDAAAMSTDGIDLVFSAVESDPARELEPLYAKNVPVISTASAFRYEDDVPLLLPGANPEHRALLRVQKRTRGWDGFVAPNPNCTTVGLAMTLAPLHRAFGIADVHLVSMQAVSGAGRSPGVIALDVVDNIIPFIPDEEGKVAAETRKVLGVIDGERIVDADFTVSATCTRVAVIEGHTLVVHVELRKEAAAEQIKAAWDQAGADLVGAFPSAPEKLIAVSDDPFRPQVRLDRDAGEGMTTTVGRLRSGSARSRSWQYMAVSHNTKMGAARGCILLAEQLLGDGTIELVGG